MILVTQYLVLHSWLSWLIFKEVIFAKEFQGITHFPKVLCQFFLKSLSSEVLICVIIFVAFLSSLWLWLGQHLSALGKPGLLFHIMNTYVVPNTCTLTFHLPEAGTRFWPTRYTRKSMGGLLGNIYSSTWGEISLYAMAIPLLPAFECGSMNIWCLKPRQPLWDHEVRSLRAKANNLQTVVWKKRKRLNSCWWYSFIDSTVALPTSVILVKWRVFMVYLLLTEFSIICKWKHS